MGLITTLILLPLIGVIAALAIPSADRDAARGVGLVTSAATLIMVGIVVGQFDRSRGSLQMVDQVTWISDLGLSWNVGVDGISLWMLLLTAALFFLAFVAIAVRMPDIHPRAFVALLLLAEFGLLGLFAAGDLVLFYIFWEAMLIPFAFLIWMWGNRDRGRATLTFVIYTMVGSLVMLVAILATAFLAKGPGGELTFNIAALANHDWTQTQSTWLFAAFALAFLIKLPVFPLHGWMPGAYAAAPLVVTALLSAVMSKAGAYGLLRVGVPLFPEGAHRLAITVSILALCGIIYGSLLAWRATTMRMLVAYSSLAHLGFIVLGIMSFTTIGGQGAVLQMVNHGIVTAAAFAIVAIVARAKHGDEEMDQISGLAKGAPWLAGIFLIVAMAALAVPGSNAFVGEFFILTGTFAERPVIAVFACIGIAYAAIYMLRMYQSTMNGPSDGDAAAAELRRGDVLYLAPLVIAMLFIALWPAAIAGSTKTSVECATTAAASLEQPVSPGQPPATKPISTDYLGCR